MIKGLGYPSKLSKKSTGEQNSIDSKLSSTLRSVPKKQKSPTLSIQKKRLKGLGIDVPDFAGKLKFTNKIKKQLYGGLGGSSPKSARQIVDDFDSILYDGMSHI